MSRFRPFEHLRRPTDFQAVYDRRRSAADGNLVVYVRENGMPCTRIGLSVSKKHGTAVRRNRLRRLLREAFRLSKHDLPSGLDLVVIPRIIDRPTIEMLQASLVKLTGQAARKIQREPSTAPPTEAP